MRAFKGAHEDRFLGVVQLGALLDTMSTETGEKNVNAAAHVKALETVVEDTEAELARLHRSKVANMVKMYQGAHRCSSLVHKTTLAKQLGKVEYMKARSPIHTSLQSA